MKRLSKRDLPPYKFIPGKALHPEKLGGYQYKKLIKFEEISQSLIINEDFRYAFDLFNLHYYWEAHVYFEGLWHQVRKKDLNCAYLLQALIKFCAAGVKLDLKQKDASIGHLLRGVELLDKISNSTVKKINVNDLKKLFSGINLDKFESIHLSDKLAC